MRKLIVLASLVALHGCGGSSGSSPTPVATPTPTPRPSASKLTLGVTGTPTFTIRSTTQVLSLILKCGDFHAEWVITESAGLGATLLRADVSLIEADGDIADRRITEFNERVPLNGTLILTSDRFECGYEGRDLPMTMKAIEDLRDDAGNSHQLTATTGFTER